MNKLRLQVMLVSTLCLGGMSCSSGGGAGSSNPTGLTFDLTGIWAGTWTSAAGDSGPLSIEFIQKASVQGGGPPAPLQGTAELEGYPCPALLNVDASISPGGFASSPYFSGVFTDGSVTMDVFATVTIDATGFFGSYEVLEGGLCKGETGTIQASLATPLLPPTFPKPQVNQVQTIVVLHDGQGNRTSSLLIEQIDPKTGTVLKAQHRLDIHQASGSVDE